MVNILKYFGIIRVLVLLVCLGLGWQWHRAGQPRLSQEQLVQVMVDLRLLREMVDHSTQDKATKRTMRQRGLQEIYERHRTSEKEVVGALKHYTLRAPDQVAGLYGQVQAQLDALWELEEEVEEGPSETSDAGRA